MLYLGTHLIVWHECCKIQVSELSILDVYVLLQDMKCCGISQTFIMALCLSQSLDLDSKDRRKAMVAPKSYLLGQLQLR